MSFLEKLFFRAKSVQFHFTYDWCYDQEEARGNAVFGVCGGVVGGTGATNYLSEKCVNCPHFVSKKFK